MKKIIIGISIAIVLAGIFLNSIPIKTEDTLIGLNNKGTIRTMVCIVTDSDNTVQVLKDSNNMLWGISDSTVHEGDVLCVQFDDMNTPKNLVDDVILDYCEVVIN